MPLFVFCCLWTFCSCPTSPLLFLVESFAAPWIWVSGFVLCHPWGIALDRTIGEKCKKVLTLAGLWTDKAICLSCWWRLGVEWNVNIAVSSKLPVICWASPTMSTLWIKHFSHHMWSLPDELPEVLWLHDVLANWVKNGRATKGFEGWEKRWVKWIALWAQLSSLLPYTACSFPQPVHHVSPLTWVELLQN